MRIPKPHTPPRSIPVLNLNGAVQSTSSELSRELGESLQAFGFVGLSNHGIDETLVDHCYTVARQFFGLSEATKLEYFDPDGRGARGYIPFGREKAKDRDIGDLKEFWHVGRELGARRTDVPLPANVWPAQGKSFRRAVLELYTALDQLGGFVLRLLAPHLGLAPTFFDDKVDHGNSVLRLLHYPPLPASAQPLGTSSQGGAVRAAAHEDINLITFLVSAEGPGLEILIRRGEWLPAPSGRGVIVCNVGDMMQRLTNQCLAIHAPPGRQSAPAVWRRVALLDAISYTRTANCRSRLYRPASRMNARIATPRRSPPMRT